eukprot:365343-Chlamydomonas_euryale.AAC.1
MSLGSHCAAPGGTTLRVLSGMVPLPLSAPREPTAVGAPAGGDGPVVAYHPILGALSNHPCGFHPSLDEGPGDGAAARPPGQPIGGDGAASTRGTPASLNPG